MPAAFAVEGMVTSPKPGAGIASMPNPTVFESDGSLSMTQTYFNVEAQRHAHSTAESATIRNAVSSLIQSMESLSLVSDSVVTLDSTDWTGDSFLTQHVERVVIPDLDEYRAQPGESIDVQGSEHVIHVYAVNEGGPQNEQLEGGEEELAAGKTKWKDEKRI